MSWITKLILTILVIIAIGLVVLIFSPSALNFTTSTTEAKLSGLPDNALPIEVVALDDEQYTPQQVVERLHSGEAQLLLWVEKSGSGKRLNVYVFNNVQTLAKFDKDNSGRLDMSDPFFHNLMVARFDSSNNMLYYSPVQESGVAAIMVDPAYLSAELLSDPRRYANVAGKVINSDSSTRVLHVVILPASDLKDVGIMPQPKVK